MNPHSKIQPVRPTVYDSAVDLWIALILLLGPSAALAISGYCLLDGRPGEARIFFFTAFATIAVTLAFTTPCRYTVDSDFLSIRCGLLHYQIPLGDIIDVEPSRTLISGPALSLRRVLVRTNKRNHVLSPSQREAFIDDLRGEIDKRS